MTTKIAKLFLFDDEKRPPKRRNTIFNLTTTNRIKKCLFGVCNPADTEVLLQEQFEIDRTRILNKFGFDVQDVENLENGQLIKRTEAEINKEPNSVVCGNERRKMVNKSRGVFKPYNRENQAVITGELQSKNQRKNNEIPT